MTETLGGFVRKGMRAIRRFFSDKAGDSLEIRGDRLHYLSDGQAGSCDVREIKNITLEQSFLGLFGTTLAIRRGDGSRIVIKGLEEGDAKQLKDRADEAYLRSIVADARQSLQRASARIADAAKSLLCDDYLSAFQMSQWQEEYGDLRFLVVLDDSTIRSAGADAAALECKKALAETEAWRSARNDKWVAESLSRHKPVFDRAGSVPLTLKQREAILRNDNRVLAVAGAGTGKTTTVVAKVRFLLHTKWCKPHEILLLSFSRGAVEELKTRVAEACGDEVEVRTFHSLGLEIIAEATGRKPAVFEQSSNGNLIDTIASLLEELLKGPQTRGQVLSFLAYHFYPARSEHDFASKGDFLRFVSSNDIRTLKDEVVKSNQEAQIANWLYLNGIRYVYEAEFKEARTGSSTKRLYKPDFYLPEHGVYIEHFGVDRSGNTAPWIDRAQYQNSMQWKRSLHREHGTKLVQTYSYQAREGSLIAELRSQLTAFGVNARPIPMDELIASQQIRRRLRPAAKLLSTTLTLFKGERSSLADLEQRIGTDLGDRRAAVFLAVFREVYGLYESMLAEKGEVDFGDMIIEAARLVESRRYRSRFRVVVVDEFQDISRGRAWLMNTLLEQVDDARLLCVGDDWQSIYRFAGSDVSLMTGYKTQWRQAVRVDLDRSFRFNDRLQEVTSRFITQNPVQLKKKIECATSRKEPAVHIVTSDLNDLMESLESKSPGASVLLLGRYNHTVPRQWANESGESATGVRCMTVHKAKGREADYVIVNNVEAGRYGFPTEMVDDPLIRVFLTEAEAYSNAEERRLFYVALTRARHDVWLRVSPQHPSAFVEELLRSDAYKGLVTAEMDAVAFDRKCPECSGPVVMRQNNQKKSVFLGCVYYPRCNGTLPGCPECGKAIPERVRDRFRCPACDWDARACPKCAIGYAKRTRGRNGEFWGCSRFVADGCRWTENAGH